MGQSGSDQRNRNADGGGHGELHVCDNAVVYIQGTHGGLLITGWGDASGITLIDTGAQVIIDPGQPGGTGLWGAIVDVVGPPSGSTLTVNDTALLSAGYICIHQNGVLSGNGNIIGLVIINNRGTLAPGTSPGTLNIDGDLIINAGSQAELDLKYTAIVW